MLTYKLATGIIKFARDSCRFKKSDILKAQEKVIHFPKELKIAVQEDHCSSLMVSTS